jgi:hypothetical protein
MQAQRDPNFSLDSFGTSFTAAMANEIAPPPPPTFKEALKQDRAQFDDCTPCRVVGTFLPPLPTATAAAAAATDIAQAAQPLLASAHSHTFRVTRS